MLNTNDYTNHATKEKRTSAKVISLKKNDRRVEPVQMLPPNSRCSYVSTSAAIVYCRINNGAPLFIVAEAATARDGCRKNGLAYLSYRLQVGQG